jgi:hypothetical protein
MMEDRDMGRDVIGDAVMPTSSVSANSACQALVDCNTCPTVSAFS